MESCFGGLLIGSSCSINYYLKNRITGISGILNGLSEEEWKYYFIRFRFYST